MKKNFVFLFLILFCCTSVFAMKKNENKKDLIIFAAASMTESLTELGKIYEKENPNVKLIFNFDSSGTLRAQIMQKADCDVFLSASRKQADDLLKKDFIDEDSCFDLLENKTVLAVKKGNESKVSSFADFAKKLKSGKIFAAIGGADVPVGQYTRSIFNYYGIDEKSVQGSLSYGSNVKEVVLQVKEGSADCGIIYKTDCASANLVSVAEASAEETAGRVLYPLCILKSSKNKAEATRFVQFLKSDKAKAVFEDTGFTRV